MMEQRTQTAPGLTSSRLISGMSFSIMLSRIHCIGTHNATLPSDFDLTGLRFDSTRSARKSGPQPDELRDSPRTQTTVLRALYSFGVPFYKFDGKKRIPLNVLPFSSLRWRSMELTPQKPRNRTELIEF